MPTQVATDLNFETSDQKRSEGVLGVEVVQEGQNATQIMLVLQSKRNVGDRRTIRK